MDDEKPIVVEVVLSTGQRISGPAKIADVLESQMGLAGEVLSNRPQTDRERALSIASTAVTYRMEKGTGFFTLYDQDGRWWVVRASNIVAASISDPQDPDAPRRVGFIPPPSD